MFTSHFRRANQWFEEPYSRTTAFYFDRITIFFRKALTWIYETFSYFQRSHIIARRINISSEAAGDEPEKFPHLELSIYYYCNHQPPQIHISTCNQLKHESFLRWVSRGGHKKSSWRTYILLHFIPPKLEYFSKKQLNQNHLQTDAIGAPPTLVSSLYRGVIHFCSIFWSIIGFAKAWMAYLLSPFKFAPCTSWRRVWLNRTKTAPE